MILKSKGTRKFLHELPLSASRFFVNLSTSKISIRNGVYLCLTLDPQLRLKKIVNVKSKNTHQKIKTITITTQYFILWKFQISQLSTKVVISYLILILHCVVRGGGGGGMGWGRQYIYVLDDWSLLILLPFPWTICLKPFGHLKGISDRLHLNTDL